MAPEKSGDKIITKHPGQLLKTLFESGTTTFPQFYSHFNF